MKLIEKANGEDNLGMLGAFDLGNGLRCAGPTLKDLLDILPGLPFFNHGLPIAVQIVTAATLEAFVEFTWDREVENAARVIRLAREKADERAIKYLSSALRSSGAKPGPKRTQEYNRDRVNELMQRMNKVGLKEIPLGGGDPVKQGWSVSAKLLRFYRQVRRHHNLMGQPDVSTTCSPTFASWFKQKLGFDLPNELPLVNYALRLARH